MFVENESQTIGGFGRNDRFSYAQRFGGSGLDEKKQSLGAEDEAPFSMRLLHFRRTFVEKMFAIHSKVELCKREKQRLGSYVRHYYDLFQLSEQPEIGAMLRSAAYAAIKTDYDQISRAHFARSYFFPEGMSFAPSDALFPSSKTCGTHSR
jgi:hypothetical protein